jgi:hypothetical protein
VVTGSRSAEPIACDGPEGRPRRGGRELDNRERGRRPRAAPGQCSFTVAKAYRLLRAILSTAVTDKPESQKEANRAHAKLRSPGERANAQLKTWRILRKLRCCPWRAGQLAKAIHALQIREA